LSLQPSKQLTKLTTKIPIADIQGDLYYPFPSVLPLKQMTIPSSCLASSSYFNSDGSIRLLSFVTSFSINDSSFSAKRIYYISTVIMFDNNPRRLRDSANIWNRSFSPFYNFQKSFQYDLKNLF
jgi:hypothetical protein